MGIAQSIGRRTMLTDTIENYRGQAILSRPY
jgi:hypothetical protein